MAMIRFALMALALLLALPATAQQAEEDKGFLTRQLQDLLSGAGREVRIDGFAGALSSAASFEVLTISDGDGVWLRVEDVVLNWSRAALLRGRLEVAELSAARIDLMRLPIGDPDTLPDAEATPFELPQLPDLPVSINIAALNIAQLRLGAPILGRELVAQMTANAVLNDAGLDADFVAERTDGNAGRFELSAVLAREDGTLDLGLVLREAADGLVSNLLNIPDRPSVDLSVQAAGPLDDLRTQLQLSTDGTERLAGEIVIAAPQGTDRRITADIGGDLTAIILPQYRDFFGPQVALQADAVLAEGGAVQLDRFALRAAAVALEGRAALAPGGWPTLLDIEGTIARADGAAVALPGGNGTTFVDRIVLDVDFDAAQGETYQAVFDIDGLVTEAATVGQTTLRSSGTLSSAGDAIHALRGDLVFDALGVALQDTALAEALGDTLSGRVQLSYATDAPLRLDDLTLTGSDYGLAGDIEVDGFGPQGTVALDATLSADDLSRFSALAGRELDGQTALGLRGSLAPLGGTFDLRAQGSAEGIRTGITQADALLEGRTELSLRAIRNRNGTFLRDLELANEAFEFTGAAELYNASAQVTARVLLRDVAVVAPQYTGAADLRLGASQTAGEWRVDVAGQGPYDTTLALRGLATGPQAAIDFDVDVPRLSDFAEGVDGPLRATGSLRQTPQGWRIDTDANGPYDATARIEGALTERLDLGFDLSLPQLSRVAPDLSGPLRASGRLRQTDAGFALSAEAAGPFQSAVTVDGALTPALDMQFTAAVPNVAALAPGVNGPLRTSGRLRQTQDGFSLAAQASGPYRSEVTVEGALTPALDMQFTAAVPNVAPLAPGVNGPLRTTGRVRQTDAGIAVQTNINGPYASTVSLSGVVTGDRPAVEFSAALPNTAPLVPGLEGPLSLRGTAAMGAQGWQIDTDLRGPSGTQATVAGQVGEGGQLALGINGSAPLGLAGPFIAPRRLEGLARFDLRLDGPAGLEALSGRITASGATLSAPNLRVALEGIEADIRLAAARAQIDLNAAGSEGGQLAVQGSIALADALRADLGIGLRGLVIVDPRLYRTTVSGDLRLSGPLAGGADIAGDIAIGETTVTVPSTGLTSIGEIPAITHLDAPASAQATRRRAGLLEEDAADDPATRSGGGGFGLDVRINAPGRIFVRGRGLDAELGGSLRLTGSTGDIVSAGRFELLRGRLDILGKRFDLEEGSAQFQGGLVPYIRFVSTTTTETGTASIIVEGQADAPEVTFESDPDGPQDEVLAQLLFGRNLSELSAFQALQLANAVATLAGRGGSGVVSNLREQFDLDDLDVTTTDSGETALRVGKYLTDNVYTDVTAASDGTGEVSLNIDISPSLKGRATLGSDGESSFGIFFERDY